MEEEEEGRQQLQEEEEGGGGMTKQPDTRRKKRGRVELKRIEDRTSRQVRFSKRRSGLFKKAFELSELCDAQVALLVFSPAGRLYEYVSSNTSFEELFGRYRSLPNKTNDLDNELDLNKKSAPDSLPELNDFAQWSPESDVNEMSMAELMRLEEIMTDALAVIKNKLMMKVAELAQTEKKRKEWSTGSEKE